MITQPTHIICSILIFTTATIEAAGTPENSMQSGSVTLTNDYKIEAEIAATKQQREHGLMYRISLNENHGMLFVYPEETRQGVWMKNTLLALDVLFLSERGKVVDIVKNLQPCLEEPCPIYISKTRAKYMLEISAGVTDRQHIEPGQELILEYNHSNTEE